MTSVKTVRKMNAEERKFFSLMRTRATFEDQGFKPMNFATMSAKVLSSPGLGTMACDSKWRVYIDFDYWMSEHESVETSTNGFMHEIGHLVRNHFSRFSTLSSQEAERVNQAGDIEINNLLFLRMQMKRPAFEILTCETYDFENNLTAEEYYNLLKESQTEDPQTADSKGDGDSDGDQGDGEGEGNSSPSPCAGGSGTGGKPLDIEAMADEIEPGLNDIEAAVVRKNVARDVIEASRKGRGNITGELLRWANLELAPPEVDWRTKIMSPIRSIIMNARIHQEKNWARPSRRQAISRNGIIIPSMHGPKPMVCYIADTSMSMGVGEGSRVATEMNGLLSDPRINLTVISADADVSEIIENVRSIEDVRFTGGGGTDMRIPLLRAKELHKTKRFTYVIVATDGGTPWPKEDEVFPFKIIVVRVDNGSSQSTIPSYIEVIDVPKGM